MTPAPPPPPSPGQLKKLAEQKESRHNFELLLIEAAQFYSQVLGIKVDPEILSEALDKIANNKNIGSMFTNKQMAGITLGASTLTGAGFLSIFDYGAKQIPGFDSLKGLLTESLLDSPLIVGGGAGFAEVARVDAVIFGECAGHQGDLSFCAT